MRSVVHEICDIIGYLASLMLRHEEAKTIIFCRWVSKAVS